MDFQLVLRKIERRVLSLVELIITKTYNEINLHYLFSNFHYEELDKMILTLLTCVSFCASIANHPFHACMDRLSSMNARYRETYIAQRRASGYPG